MGKKTDCDIQTFSQELPVSSLITSGRPIAALQQLFDLMGIVHDGTMASIVAATQTWLRKTPERWQIQPQVFEKQKEAFELLAQIGCLEAATPAHKVYDYALVLGGPEPRARRRMQYLIELWEKGVRVKKVVLLTGDRPLDPILEHFKPPIVNETEMMQFLYAHTPMPESLKALPWIVVDTPKGTKSRPNTADTAIEWLKSSPTPGSCLVISCQPFIGYQDAVLKTQLPKIFSVETVGPEAPKDTLLEMCLDNLARWIYTEAGLGGH
jgi:hypothetical protein